MPMPTLQQIIGTITGKVAFERTQANFTTIKTTHDALETVVGTKAPNADLVAHKAESTAHDINLKADKLQQEWISPTLLNGWVNMGGYNATANYFKDNFGIVHLKGMVKIGALNQPIFILPSGYRPTGIQYFPVIANDTIGRLTIYDSGNVILDVGSTTTVSFNGISFKAEV